MSFLELTKNATPEDRRRVADHVKSTLAAFEAEVRLRAALEVFLEVADGNAPALALYNAAGYRPRGHRSGYYQKPDGTRIDAILLGKPL